MDMQLIFVLLLSAWLLFKGIETSKWRYLFGAAAMIGLGFNIKMLQAYMILPAVALVYLFFAKGKPVRRILAGAISLVILAAVSLIWVAAVDLYPSGQRPYVGSSTNNTEMELIVGHNGIERLSGQGGGMSRGIQGKGGFQGNGQRMDGRRNQPQNGNQPNAGGTPPAQPGQNNNGGNTGANGPANGNNGGNPSLQGNNNNGPGQFGHGGSGQRQGGAVGNDIGTAGILRLWNAGMLGQASWLIIFALFCIAVKIKRFDWRHPALKQGGRP
jgi:4-amino-4-deoxy-L-arabinose transferase-like glycosyltransferase